MSKCGRQTNELGASAGSKAGRAKPFHSGQKFYKKTPHVVRRASIVSNKQEKEERGVGEPMLECGSTYTFVDDLVLLLSDIFPHFISCPGALRPSKKAVAVSIHPPDQSRERPPSSLTTHLQYPTPLPTPISCSLSHSHTRPYPPFLNQPLTYGRSRAVSFINASRLRTSTSAPKRSMALAPWGGWIVDCIDRPVSRSVQSIQGYVIKSGPADETPTAKSTAASSSIIHMYCIGINGRTTCGSALA